MINGKCQLILIAVVLVILILIFRNSTERFINKDLRAKDITNYFTTNPDANYSDYKRKVNDSDIVEYTEVKKLKRKNALDVDSVRQVL